MSESVRTGSRLQIVPLSDEHAEPLAAFFREMWGADGSADEVLAAQRRAAAENPVDPGMHPPTMVALREGRVVGYCSSLPNRLWDGTREVGSYWAKGLMVVPELRNGPIGFLVLKALTAQFRIGTSVTVADGSKRLFGALGYRDYGAAPNFLLPLALGFIAAEVSLDQMGTGRMPPRLVRAVQLLQRVGVARLGGAVLGAVLRIPQFVQRRAGLEVVAQERLDHTEMNALWARCRDEIRAAPVRDAAFLLGRYQEADGGARYRFVTVHDAGALVGLGIVRRIAETGDPRLGAIRVAALSDALFPPSRPDVAQALLAGVRRLALRSGAHAVLCTASHRALRTALRRAGYIPIGGNIHFFIRDPGAVATWPDDLADWWITRGDGFSDESF
jgi:hypothetical protein